WPNHTVINSTQPTFQGNAAIELVFHEASHTIVSPRSDAASVVALQHAAELEGIELHRDLWHIVLFYTAGFAAERAIAELWREPYEMYMSVAGVTARAWPQFAAALASGWRPYLEGKLSLEDAARIMVRAGAP